MTTEMRERICNYINRKKANEPRYYDHRYGTTFSHSTIVMCVIAVLILQSPMYIAAILSLLLNIYGLIFFIVIGIPTLIIFSIIANYYINKHINNNFYINTNFGKAKIRRIMYKNKPVLCIYFNKVLQNIEIKKNMLSYIIPRNKPKYTRLIIIKDDIIFLRNLFEYIKDYDKEIINLIDLINNAELNIEYVNLEEKIMGKVNINTAKVSQLSRLPFLGKINAVKVANYIRKNGEFETIWDFAEYIKLPQNKYELLYKYVTVRKTVKNIPVIEQIKNDIPQFDNTLDI